MCVCASLSVSVCVSASVSVCVSASVSVRLRFFLNAVLSSKASS